MVSRLGEGDWQPPLSMLVDGRLSLRIFAKYMCVLSLRVSWSATPCGSYPSVGARPSTIYEKPFDSINERTPEVSS